MRRLTSRGFTLVELLVVITIIGVLVGLLMPAVQAARESSRNIQCRNNLGQIAKAFLAHEEAQGFLPTGGWGGNWMGDPDRGFTNKQPGGWLFNILPHMSRDDLWKLSLNVNGNKSGNELTLWATPFAAYTCPTRHRSTLGPNAGNTSYWPGNATPPKMFRADYAANMGGWNLKNGLYVPQGEPTSYSQVDGPPPMTDAQFDAMYGSDSELNGITYQHSQLKLAAITDGQGCTYCVGEKYLDPDHYNDGKSGGDDNGAWMGFDQDICRQADLTDIPMQDTSGVDNTVCFGSAHVSGLNASFCDGAARTISYSINPATHINLAARNDGNPVDMSQLQ